ncbi:ATP-binding cassette domain-containing protein [Candidatus Peregrinibacteria bacterium]|nr:ATP-binding cassette domain-containing protein [Candidatus Peregrinibacteria bacterium]
MLLGMEPPTEGRILINERDLRHIADDEMQQYRRNLGVVFQDSKLLPNKTVFENAAYALEACDYSLSQIAELVPQALEIVGISHLQDQYPHELSGGEAQRAALVRAVVHKPKLVIADEPTGNLDLENAKQVLKNLVKINLAGATVILTTHNKPLVEMIGQKVVYI